MMKDENFWLHPWFNFANIWFRKIESIQKAIELCELSTFLVSMEFDIPNVEFHFNFFKIFAT